MRVRGIVKDFYDVREMIGHGTSGEVRRAINRTTGKQVAVKVIETRKFALTPGLTPKELVQEAEMLKRVDHEYIIKLEDIFQVRGEQARGREAQGGRGGPRERRQADRRQLLGTERLYTQGENGKGGTFNFLMLVIGATPVPWPAFGCRLLVWKICPANLRLALVLC